jgi:hypothetical protein
MWFVSGARPSSSGRARWSTSDVSGCCCGDQSPQANRADRRRRRHVAGPSINRTVGVVARTLFGPRSSYEGRAEKRKSLRAEALRRTRRTVRVWMCVHRVVQPPASHRQSGSPGERQGLLSRVDRRERRRCRDRPMRPDPCSCTLEHVRMTRDLGSRYSPVPPFASPPFVSHDRDGRVLLFDQIPKRKDQVCSSSW